MKAPVSLRSTQFGCSFSEMITVGITGQIGCGKSVVAKEFRRLGAVVLSGDQLGKDAVNKHPQVLRSLVKAFGNDILNRTGQLDRKRLGRLAFADPTRTRLLDKIVHPWLLKELRSDIRKVQSRGLAKMVIVDAALIFDWRLERELDYVIVVESTLANQLARVVTRGLTEREIRDRIHRQIPKYKQRRKADFVIPNNGSKDELIARASRLYRKLERLTNALTSQTAESK